MLVHRINVKKKKKNNNTLRTIQNGKSNIVIKLAKSETINKQTELNKTRSDQTKAPNGFKA